MPPWPMEPAGNGRDALLSGQIPIRAEGRMGRILTLPPERGRSPSAAGGIGKRSLPFPWRLAQGERCDRGPVALRRGVKMRPAQMRSDAGEDSSAVRNSITKGD